MCVYVCISLSLSIYIYIYYLSIYTHTTINNKAQTHQGHLGQSTTPPIGITPSARPGSALSSLRITFIIIITKLF